MTKTNARKISDLGDPKFELGMVVSTPGVIDAVSRPEMMEGLRTRSRSRQGALADGPTWRKGGS